MMTKQRSCEDRKHEKWASRKEDLEALWAVYTGEREPCEEYGEDGLHEYGLSFDYVAPGTFEDQNEGYWRYQLSWGGPSDEIRFYSSNSAGPIYKAEYWFMDWFDGAKTHVHDEEIVHNLWEMFSEVGSTESAYRESMGGE